MTIGGRAMRHSYLRGAYSVDAVTLRRIVDLTCVVLALALFLGIGDAEMVIQALWLTVAIGAFTYGLRAALARIAIAACIMVAFLGIASAAGLMLQDHLEFTEWPLMAIIAIIVAILADRLSTSARHYAALYRQASERLVTAHEVERGRLARDLHDGVGQTLTAVVLTLDAVENELQTINGDAPVAGRESIKRARDLAATALAETRDVATQLRPNRVHETGLGAALRNLAGSAGVAVEMRLDPALLPAGSLDQDTEIDLYRIVQEAVGNAARHSQAKQIWIDGRIVDGTLRLVVGDDGVGFSPEDRDRGLGLDGMRERAEIHGGVVTIRSGLGHGTRVDIVMPMANGPDAPGPAGTVPALDGAY